ncbi:hypothetical protein ACMD2_04447, partial [Ananas comosus]
IPDLHDDDDDDDDEDDQEDHLKRPLCEDHPKTPSQLLSCFSLLTLPSCSKLQPDSAARRRRGAEGRALRTERLLGARRDLGAFVDAELARLRARFVPPAPLRPRDVPRLLLAPAPRAPPLAAAALAWLGGPWRPSAVLSRLLPALAARARAPSPLAGLPPRALRALAEAARSLRAHEAALDAEVAEYQATCILKLDFAEAVGGRRRGTEVVVEAAAEEMRKMGKIVRKAGKLRYQAVEVAAKGVLDPAQAAEFLVALAGVQETVRRHAERWNARVGTLSITDVNSFNATTAAVVGGRRRRTEMVVETAVEEMRKMGKIVRKAGKLRYRAVEVAAKGVLDPAQAAEFLVALAGVQETVQRHAEWWNTRVGTLSIAVVNSFYATTAAVSVAAPH